MSWPTSLLGEILNIPSVEALPIPLVAPIFERSQALPNPVAYIPQFLTGYTTNMSFWQRASNLFLAFVPGRIVAQMLILHMLENL